MRRYAALACLMVAGCSAGPLEMAGDGDHQALVYRPTGASWDVLTVATLGSFEGGCLSVTLVDVVPWDSGPFIAGVPAGSTVADDGRLRLPDGTVVALGEQFTFGQEPFEGTGAQAVTSEYLEFSPLPDGCPEDAEVVLILPIPQD